MLIIPYQTEKQPYIEEHANLGGTPSKRRRASAVRPELVFRPLSKGRAFAGEKKIQADMQDAFEATTLPKRRNATKSIPFDDIIDLTQSDDDSTLPALTARTPFWHGSRHASNDDSRTNTSANRQR